MAVHKSQGSEFDRVLIILSPKDSLVLTPELLYTAITRAKKSGELWGIPGIIEKCVGRVVHRFSGITGL